MDGTTRYSPKIARALDRLEEAPAPTTTPRHGGRTSKRAGWLYVMRAESLPDRVKVGYTISCDHRIRDARTWLPDATVFKQVYVDANLIESERRAHAALAQWRIGASEWFRVSAERAYAAILQASVPADMTSRVCVSYSSHK